MCTYSAPLLCVTPLVSRHIADLEKSMVTMASNPSCLQTPSLIWKSMVAMVSQGAQVVNSPPANAGDARDGDLIPGLGRSLREGNGNPLQYSCLGNPMDGGAWRATVHRGTKSRRRRSVRTHTHTHTHTHVSGEGTLHPRPTDHLLGVLLLMCLLGIQKSA